MAISKFKTLLICDLFGYGCLWVLDDFVLVLRGMLWLVGSDLF